MNLSVGRYLWYGLRDLFYPPICAGCSGPIDEVNALVCDHCFAALERTQHATERGNKVELLFADIGKVGNCAAFCYYKPDSLIRNIIHCVKYSGQPSLGRWLGKLAATEIMRDNPLFFADIDVVVPVPMHPQKLRQRGYNQSEEIAAAVAEVIGKPLNTECLKKVKMNDSQTHKSAEQRAENTKNVFAVEKKDLLRGKRILLVDDIVTTGSTLRDCIRCLHPLPRTTFQILTMGVATYITAR